MSTAIPGARAPIPALGAAPGRGEVTGAERTVAGRNRLFWTLQFAGWGGVAPMSFYLLYNVLGLQAAWVLTPLRLASGVLVTCGLRWIYQRIPWRSWKLWHLVLGCAVFCIGLGAVEATVMHRVSQLATGQRAVVEVQPLLPAIGMALRGCIFLTWSLLYFNIKMQIEAADARLSLAHRETAARTSELRQLRAQVNPHFLFNALNSILAEKDRPEAVESITQELAEYLRFSLRPSGEYYLLGEELDALLRYLRVEKARFEEKFVYDIAASGEARQVRVPVVTVQPLLENAMKYGRLTSPTPLRVRITAEVTEGFLRLVVANTGRWVEADPTRTDGGIGLSNLRRRLELLYGQRARLETSAADGWVRVELVLAMEAVAMPMTAPVEAVFNGNENANTPAPAR